MKSDLLENFISDSYCFKDEVKRHSSLAAALRDARVISNRNIKTGVVTLEHVAPLYPNSWASALIYFVVLDQIGTCFIDSKKRSENISGNAIFKAIKHFSTLSDREAFAIESLRHSFAHNYGLANIKRDNKAQQILKTHTHLFALIAEKDQPLIEMPSLDRQWNGDYDKKNLAERVVINLWTFGDFVENVFISLREQYIQDNVELILKGKELELKTRFTFTS